MRNKKILAAVCAAVVLALCGCSDDGDINYFDDTDTNTSALSETENVSDNTDKNSAALLAFQ